MSELEQRLASLAQVKEKVIEAIAAAPFGAPDQELARKEVAIHALAAEGHLRNMYGHGFHVGEDLEADRGLLNQDQAGGIEGYRFLFKHFAYHLDWMKQVPRQLVAGQFTPDLARLSKRKTT
jgi:hypothetical protein